MKDVKINFLEYAEKYIELDDKVRLKINHTFRVMELCEMIGRSLNLSSEDLELAQLCGLLHDIGRFEQWKQYGTFDDAKSIDHGNLGVEVLKENNLIRKFGKNEQYDDLIFKTIYYHNKYKIDECLTDREKIFCNIVRDADKLDILYLCTIEDIKVDIKSDNFSEKIYNDLTNKKLILSKERVTNADKLATTLAFVFDLNFEKSIEYLKEKNYINKEIDLYMSKTKNKEMQEQLKKIKIVTNNYIEEKLKNSKYKI